MATLVTSLRKRADFLALRSATALGFPAFKLVRGRRPGNGCEPQTRVGYTVTKKMGNAVRRNRIRRRLKSVVETVFPLQAEANADYVVIARRAAYDRPFEMMIADMEKAVMALKSGKLSNKR